MSAARDERPRRAADDAGRPPGDGRPRPAPASPRLEAIVDRVGSVSGRLSRVWRALPFERRLAGLAAIGLFAALFLPWYQETVTAQGVKSLRSLSDPLTGWGAFSFVEAAVLLVAAGVLGLLFARAEGRAFHVPGGDGGLITAAGGWTCLLIIWRMFDKEGTTGHGLYNVTSGIEWGIFVALAVAGLLTYAGTRIRLAHEPEPPLPGEAPRRRRRRPGESAQPSRATARESPSWSAESDIEEIWLALERDRPPRAARRRDGTTASPSHHDATAPLPELAVDPPRLRFSTAETAPLSPPTAETAPQPPADATPAPQRRRRRPRSIAEDPPEDQLRARSDHRRD